MTPVMSRWLIVMGLVLGMLPLVQAADVALDLPGEAEFEKALRLPGGDWVVFRYHGSSDSGVRVTRLDAKMTEQRWRTQCQSLGVEHSKYRHDVTLSRLGDRLHVVSIGSGGKFEEWLDLATGKPLKRTTN